jgi:hypothetical protein
LPVDLSRQVRLMVGFHQTRYFRVDAVEAVERTVAHDEVTASGQFVGKIGLSVAHAPLECRQEVVWILGREGFDLPLPTARRRQCLGVAVGPQQHSPDDLSGKRRTLSGGAAPYGTHAIGAAKASNDSAVRDEIVHPKVRSPHTVDEVQGRLGCCGIDWMRDKRRIVLN